MAPTNDGTWRILSIANTRGKNDSQYVWLYLRLIGGFKSKLVYKAKGRKELVLESRYFGHFRELEHASNKYYEDIGVAPNYKSHLSEED